MISNDANFNATLIVDRNAVVSDQQVPEIPHELNEPVRLRQSERPYHPPARARHSPWHASCFSGLMMLSETDQAWLFFLIAGALGAVSSGRCGKLSRRAVGVGG
jgi:hypothetical protein